MLSALALPAGRRAKFAVALAWLPLIVAGFLLAPKFEDAQKNDPASFLPGGAESVRALELSERFPSGELVPAVVVYRRDGGLTAADRERIARDRADLNADRPVSARATPPPVPSRDRTTALLVVPITASGDSDPLLEATTDIRRRVGGGGGLQVKVTGPAGFSADAIEVFESIDVTLFAAAFTLVLVLLIVIYRSPIFWIIPLFAVVAAELASRAVGYAIAELGVTVNGQAASILTVLVFGAGTDYALLLVARYREELRRHRNRHEAMRIALRRAGPVILASGATVVAALLCLSLAELNGTAGMGPIGALGILLAMVSMVTLLPALLLIAGRRAFWPFIPRFGGTGADETHGAWRRVGERVARRPRAVWLASAAVLAVMSVGLLDLNSDLTTGNGFRDDVESVEGQELISRAFPAGANAPTTVIVPDDERVDGVRTALARTPGVTRTGPVERGAPGARFDVTLRPDPYSTEAFELIPDVRRAAKASGGPRTLVGGPTAEERDVRASATRDNRLLIPLVVAVVLLILAALLRAVVVPLLLVATVVLSLAAALGLGAFFFERVFQFPGMDPALPLFAFIFLVALGVDYNIFLMARVREETLRHGTRDGILRGLAVTGGVITSAGIVLAGTFSMLAVLPLVITTEIGFVIAVGVLLDTFLVRSVLVPALGLDIGDRIWWPSRLARGRRPPPAEAPALGERALSEDSDGPSRSGERPAPAPGRRRAKR